MPLVRIDGYSCEVSSLNVLEPDSHYRNGFEIEMPLDVITEIKSLEAQASKLQTILDEWADKAHRAYKKP